MSKDFERYKSSLVGDELTSFEALCFHEADDLAAPYTFFIASPRMNEMSFVANLISHAAKNAQEAIGAAYRTEGQSGAEVFAYTVGHLFEGPGCIPQLISVIGADDHFDLFECNIATERGGPIDSTFSEPHACGLVWNSFHFIEDVVGKGSSIGISLDHLTARGVEFAEWMFEARVTAMRKREQ